MIKEEKMQRTSNLRVIEYQIGQYNQIERSCSIAHKRPNRMTPDISLYVHAAEFLVGQVVSRIVADIFDKSRVGVISDNHL